VISVDMSYVPLEFILISNNTAARITNGRGGGGATKRGKYSIKKFREEVGKDRKLFIGVILFNI
jgi:hypothetical protein